MNPTLLTITDTPARKRLEEAIAAAAHHIMTPAERQQQRISFICGSVTSPRSVVEEQIYEREGNLTQLYKDRAAVLDEAATYVENIMWLYGLDLPENHTAQQFLQAIAANVRKL